ncbi:hypothetical protein DL93DRAFT_454607 [Clavulina sp. PMI_390]|nr:hypothetical protein DL93DRAFT_454607 [Clavulina sp. PMI_390]
MSPSTTFTSIFKLGRNVSKVITKVPRAFKNVRTSSKQQSKAVLPAMSSIYEISHLVDPFQPIPIKKEDDNEELNSLASTSLTTTTVDSELSTSLTGSELEDESDSDSDRTMSDDDIKLANIKIFGTENGSVARVEAVSVSDDGEDDDTIEEERAMVSIRFS